MNRIEDESSEYEAAYEDDEEGMNCPICFEYWDQCGDHRLVSLKCGHLFGEKCIRRWLRECNPGQRCCPQCKAKSAASHIRFLYARKLVVVDNSDAIRLQKDLDDERRKTTALQMDVQVLRMQLHESQDLIKALQEQVSMSKLTQMNPRLTAKSGMYKLFMEKNVEICNQGGCRVLLFGRNRRFLVASQKTTAAIFPGYGIRFLDLPTYKPNAYMYVSQHAIHDVAFDLDEDLLCAATREKTCKLFSTSTRASVEQFAPSDTSAIWSCSFDRDRSKILYLGSHNGSIFSYDIRSPRNFVKEYKTPSDMAPVVKVCSVPARDNFPFGGFLVCKLVSCWFFEYTSTGEVISSKLNVDGPFVSMSYDPNTQQVLLSTRPSSNHPTTRHILADLVKLGDSVCSLQPVHTFLGSKVQAQISRSAQIALRNNVVVAAYLEDTKVLQTWEAKNGSRMQTLQVSDKILDTCPVYLENDVYLAALTENKCRIYRFIEDL